MRLILTVAVLCCTALGAASAQDIVPPEVVRLKNVRRAPAIARHADTSGILGPVTLEFLGSDIFLGGCLIKVGVGA
jgi:hypothetical protein